MDGLLSGAGMDQTEGTTSMHLMEDPGTNNHTNNENGEHSSLELYYTASGWICIYRVSGLNLPPRP